MARRGRPPKPQETPQVADLLLNMAKVLEQQARKPNILAYQPHHKQQIFHMMDEFLRLYIGGNRSGKSYGSVAEDIWWASGTHPYIDISGKWPGEQIRGRVVAVDFERGVHQIILPLFKVLCPPHYLRGGNWDKAWQRVGNGGILHFAYNDSYIEFMSYEQSTEKFAGTSRHFTHFDEEPPKNIYTECLARLVDTGGYSWISMTPVEGMTWVYDTVYGPGEESEDKEVVYQSTEHTGPVWRVKPLHLGVIEVEMNENPHLSVEAQERYLSTLDEDERKARKTGKFVQTAGKVFKNFTVETNVTDEDFDPKLAQKQGWQIYTSVDHGWNAPTAWLWHAVSSVGAVITFGEHYKAEMTIKEHADVVKAKEASWGLDIGDIIRTGDPAMHQHSGITGTTVVDEYAKCGLYIYTDSVPKDRYVGIARMQMYFRGDNPAWKISSECPNFIKEMKALRWKAFTSRKVKDQNNPREEVHKLNDHAFDSAKYFATFLPELEPDEVVNTSVAVNEDVDTKLSQELSDSGNTKWEVVENIRR